MRKLVIVVLAATAACAAQTGAPLPADAVQVAPTRGAVWPAAQGEAELVVRAVQLSADGAQQEVTGARCAARSALYATDFSAPARVLLPDFGPSSPPVTVTCRAGAAEGSSISQPEAHWNRGLGGWPAVGISVGTGDDSGVGVGLGWYGGGTGWGSGAAAARYPALRVVLR